MIKIKIIMIMIKIKKLWLRFIIMIMAYNFEKSRKHLKREDSLGIGYNFAYKTSFCSIFFFKMSMWKLSASFFLTRIYPQIFWFLFPCHNLRKIQWKSILFKRNSLIFVKGESTTRYYRLNSALNCLLFKRLAFYWSQFFLFF